LPKKHRPSVQAPVSPKKKKKKLINSLINNSKENSMLKRVLQIEIKGH
jgi:hypothetical protein